MRRDPRDVVGRLIDQIRKPYKFEVRPVGGPGSPGALFVEGERFNFRRFYENEYLAFSLRAGRIFAPEVPFDPFSLQNYWIVKGALANNINNIVTLTPDGIRPSSTAPIDPAATSRMLKDLAANPQQASETISQYQSDPNNRVIPPGFTFTPTGPLAPTISYGKPTVHANGPTPSLMHPTAAQNQELEEFGRQLRAQGNNPLSLWGMAKQLQDLEYSHPNPQAAAAASATLNDLSLGRMAASRDIDIGHDLENIQQENRNLQEQLDQDVQFIKSLNEGNRQTNSRILSVLKVITGVGLEDDNRTWRSWWMDQLYGSPNSHNPQTGAGSLGKPKDPSGPADQAASDDEAAKGPEPTVPVRASFT
ncbi:hypothetical protein ACYOEI_36210, partial [Singulisphaera rosea]